MLNVSIHKSHALMQPNGVSHSRNMNFTHKLYTRSLKLSEETGVMFTTLTLRSGNIADCPIITPVQKILMESILHFIHALAPVPLAAMKA